MLLVSIVLVCWFLSFSELLFNVAKLFQVNHNELNRSRMLEGFSDLLYMSYSISLAYFQLYLFPRILINVLRDVYNSNEFYMTLTVLHVTWLCFDIYWFLLSLLQLYKRLTDSETSKGTNERMRLNDKSK